MSAWLWKASSEVDKVDEDGTILTKEEVQQRKDIEIFQKAVDHLKYVATSVSKIYSLDEYKYEKLLSNTGDQNHNHIHHLLNEDGHSSSHQQLRLFSSQKSLSTQDNFIDEIQRGTDDSIDPLMNPTREYDMIKFALSEKETVQNIYQLAEIVLRSEAGENILVEKVIETFISENILGIFLHLMHFFAYNSAIHLQILQTLSVLLQNCKSNIVFDCLLSNSVKKHNLYHIFQYYNNFDFDNLSGSTQEEIRSLFTSLLRLLTYRLDTERTWPYFLPMKRALEIDLRDGTSSKSTSTDNVYCPLFQHSLELIGNRDHHIKTAAQAVLLTLYRCKDIYLKQHLSKFLQRNMLINKVSLVFKSTNENFFGNISEYECRKLSLSSISSPTVRKQVSSPSTGTRSNKQNDVDDGNTFSKITKIGSPKTISPSGKESLRSPSAEQEKKEKRYFLKYYLTQMNNDILRLTDDISFINDIFALKNRLLTEHLVTDFIENFINQDLLMYVTSFQQGNSYTYCNSEFNHSALLDSSIKTKYQMAVYITFAHFISLTDHHVLLRCLILNLFSPKSINILQNAPTIHSDRDRGYSGKSLDSDEEIGGIFSSLDLSSKSGSFSSSSSSISGDASNDADTSTDRQVGKNISFDSDNEKEGTNEEEYRGKTDTTSKGKESGRKDYSVKEKNNADESNSNTDTMSNLYIKENPYIDVLLQNFQGKNSPMLLSILILIFKVLENPTVKRTKLPLLLGLQRWKPAFFVSVRKDSLGYIPSNDSNKLESNSYVEDEIEESQLEQFIAENDKRHSDDSFGNSGKWLESCSSAEFDRMQVIDEESSILKFEEDYDDGQNSDIYTWCLMEGQWITVSQGSNDVNNFYLADKVDIGNLSRLYQVGKEKTNSLSMLARYALLQVLAEESKEGVLIPKWEQKLLSKFKQQTTHVGSKEETFNEGPFIKWDISLFGYDRSDLSKEQASGDVKMQNIKSTGSTSRRYTSFLLDLYSKAVLPLSNIDSKTFYKQLISSIFSQLQLCPNLPPELNSSSQNSSNEEINMDSFIDQNSSLYADHNHFAVHKMENPHRIICKTFLGTLLEKSMRIKLDNRLTGCYINIPKVEPKFFLGKKAPFASFDGLKKWYLNALEPNGDDFLSSSEETSHLGENIKKVKTGKEFALDKNYQPDSIVKNESIKFQLSTFEQNLIEDAYLNTCIFILQELGLGSSHIEGKIKGGNVLKQIALSENLKKFDSIERVLSCFGVGGKFYAQVKEASISFTQNTCENNPDFVSFDSDDDRRLLNYLRVAEYLSKDVLLSELECKNFCLVEQDFGDDSKDEEKRSSKEYYSYVVSGYPPPLKDDELTRVIDNMMNKIDVLFGDLGGDNSSKFENINDDQFHRPISNLEQIEERWSSFFLIRRVYYQYNYLPRLQIHRKMKREILKDDETNGILNENSTSSSTSFTLEDGNTNDVGGLCDEILPLLNLQDVFLRTYREQYPYYGIQLDPYQKVPCSLFCFENTCQPNVTPKSNAANNAAKAEETNSIESTDTKKSLRGERRKSSFSLGSFNFYGTKLQDEPVSINNGRAGEESNLFHLDDDKHNIQVLRKLRNWQLVLHPLYLIMIASYGNRVVLGCCKRIKDIAGLHIQPQNPTTLIIYIQTDPDIDFRVSSNPDNNTPFLYSNSTGLLSEVSFTPNKTSLLPFRCWKINIVFPSMEVCRAVKRYILKTRDVQLAKEKAAIVNLLHPIIKYSYRDFLEISCSDNIQYNKETLTLEKEIHRSTNSGDLHADERERLKALMMKESSKSVYTV